MCDAQQHTHAVHAESGVREQRIESDPERFATADYAESIIRDYEKGGCIAFEATGKYGEYREEDAAYDLEWDLKNGVGQEKGFDVVHAIRVVAIEYVALIRIYGDVVEHCEELSAMIGTIEGVRSDVLPTKYNGAISTRKPRRF